SEKGRGACIGGIGNQLERGRSALRKTENGAASTEHGVASGRARLSQRPASWKGHFDDVVADAKKNDRASVRRPRKFSSRHNSQYRDDRRSCAPNSFRKGRAHAVLQSST